MIQPPEPQPPSAQRDSATDLPYGRLPARSQQPIPTSPGTRAADQPAEHAGLDTQAWDTFAPGGHPDGQSDDDEPSSALEVAPARSDSDDDVHFGVAAKALGVSRKTVERMVKRGQLERGPSGAAATVSKRALVAVLEQRRLDVSHLTRATEIEQAEPEFETEQAGWPPDATTQLQELLQPLLDEFVAARTRAAVLESQMESIREAATRQRARDELLFALAAGGWRQRRRARRAVLRHYVLGGELASPPDA
jgi:hypothetical protein